MNSCILCFLLAYGLCSTVTEFSIDNVRKCFSLKGLSLKPYASINYLGTRIQYNPNTSATFQIKLLLLAGDINPNPGPDGSPVSSNLPKFPRKYNLSELMHMRDSCQKLRIPLQAWRTIKELRINSKRPTHRRNRNQYNARIQHSLSPSLAASDHQLESCLTSPPRPTRSLNKKKFALWNARSILKKNLVCS